MKDVRVELYRSFVHDGRAPAPREISDRLQIPLEEVEAGLRGLADLDVIAFKPGTEEVWLVHPFCSGDAPFSVTSGERRWDAICIWDALGILALVGSDGQVATSCPDCYEPLNVEVSNGEILGPPEAVVHFGVPAREWYVDIAYT